MLIYLFVIISKSAEETETNPVILSLNVYFNSMSLTEDVDLFSAKD